MRIILSGILLALVTNVVKGQEQQLEQSALPPGWWLIPKTNTQLKIGGYVKLDFIHDFNPIASPDFFDVSKIPTDGSEGQSTHLHAKETRLNLDVRSNTKVGELRAFVEGDFYGASGSFRLRHAFVEIGGKWLAGQWWSNFMDESIIPNTLDFEKPAAYAFARNPMLRFKQSVGADAYVAIAFEEPHANAQTPQQAGHFENPLPDLTARYRITKSWGHFQLSGFAAKLAYRFDAGGTDDVLLFGGNISGQLNILKSDKLIYQAVYGPGAARYRGGASAALDSEGELEPLTDVGFTIGYEHRWSPSFLSVFVFNHGAVDNTAGQPLNSISEARYVAANLIWNFTEHAFAGIEYLWGYRNDLDDSDGMANRLQFSVKYSF